MNSITNRNRQKMKKNVTKKETQSTDGKVYYHITHGYDSWIKIQRRGLKASFDGYIYLLTRKDITNYVAVRQLGIIDSYGVLKVDSKGITGIVEDDNVAEFTAKYQRRVNQKMIKPEFIKPVNMYCVDLVAVEDFFRQVVMR